LIVSIVCLSGSFSFIQFLCSIQFFVKAKETHLPVLFIFTVFTKVCALKLQLIASQKSFADSGLKR